MSAMHDVVAEGSLRLSSMPWVNVTERDPHILDLIDFDPDIEALVMSCLKAPDDNDCPQIVFIALEDILFSYCCGSGREEGRRAAFQGQHAA